MTASGGWPNLLVAGTQKAGTTWLQRALRLHPEVSMSEPKELYFFGRPGWRDPARQAWYRSQFPTGAGVRYRGEASSDYFWRREPSSPWSPAASSDDDAAVGIATSLGPDAVVFVLLRSPVERAIAGANHHLTMGRIGPDDDLLAAPPELGIIDLGFYGRHLEHWRSVLDPGQIEVIVFDDLIADPLAVFESVLDRLGLASESIDDDARVEIARPAHTRQEIRDHRGRSGLRDITITATTVERLLAVYADDLERLESLLGRSLSRWRDRAELTDRLANTGSTPPA